MAPNDDTSVAAPLDAVAAAVGIQEGVSGVRSVLVEFGRPTTTSNRDVARATGLPIPIVTAVANELRRAGLLTRDRPSRPTPSGRGLVGDAVAVETLRVDCPTCLGTTVAIPAELEPATARLAELTASGSAVDMTLDQSHCTPETKVRRVMVLARAGLLPGAHVLLVGDDDLVSLALGVVSEQVGAPLVERVTVVDVDQGVLDHIAAASADLPVAVECVHHDLREPLPARLRGQFDVAMTDPPYTTPGAALFLSRAVEGLRPGAGRPVFFSFGAKGPDDMADVAAEIAALGLVAREVDRDFNEYLGSGTLGGTSTLQHLVTTSRVGEPGLASHTGALYTAEVRPRTREYVCTSCRTAVAVGPSARWTSLAALREHGCPTCGADRFRPGSTVPA